MGISAKVKSLFDLTGRKQQDMAEMLGMSKQAMSNKRTRESWSGSDLIKVAELTGTTLAFVNSEGKVLCTLDMDDVKERKRPVKPGENEEG